MIVLLFDNQCVGCHGPTAAHPTIPHTTHHTLPPTLPPFENLKAHAAVVVRAFPEAGAVIGGVRDAVGAEAPVPLAVGTDYVVADERPFGLG